MRRDGIKRGIASNHSIHNCPSCKNVRSANMVSVYQELKELKTRVSNISRVHITNMKHFQYLNFYSEEERENLIEHLIKTNPYDMGLLSFHTFFQPCYHRHSQNDVSYYNRKSTSVYTRKAKYCSKNLTQQQLLL